MRKPEKKTDKKSKEVESKKSKKIEKEEKEIKKVTKKASKEKNKPSQLQGKGRRKGVTFSVKKKIKDQLEEAMQGFVEEFDAFGEQLDSFVEKGNKSAARKSRKNLMNLQKLGKTLRNLIQEGKETLIEEAS
jgi:hypothetical protein